MKNILLIIVLSALCCGSLDAQESDNTGDQNTVDNSLKTLYRIQTYRAAPGHLQEFIAINQQLATQGFYAGWSERAPFIGRHSQGDHWDIMLIHPMISYSEYFAAEKLTQRQAAHQKHAALLERLEAITAFKEDLFSYGPMLQHLEMQFKDNSFLHIEIFHAVAGKKQELLQQRITENAYLTGVGRTANEIFVMDGGGDADIMTIGFYPSLQEFAKPQVMNEQQRDVVAKRVGFKSLDDISYYLRSLISAHHDTLANVVATD